MNYTSRNVKLYPKNFKELDELQIIELCNEIQYGSWGPCLYNWNKKDNALELLYVRKYRSEALLPEKILNAFHYWEIQGDEGNSSDIIIGQSESYYGETEGINIPNKKKYWDYGNYCLYQSNGVRITGKSEKMEEILNEVFLDESKILIDTKFKFEKKIEIVYKSCSDRMCVDQYSKAEIMKFELNKHLFEDGRMHQILNGDFKGFLFRDNLFSKLFDDMRANRIIEMIEFLYNGRVTHKYHYKNESLIQLTGDYWDNCVDIEYLKFKKWYRNEIN